MWAKLQDPRFSMAVLVIMIAAAYDFAVTFWQPKADLQMMGQIQGVLNSLAVTAVMYWLGSSKSSSEKGEELATLKAKEQSPVPASSSPA